MKASEVFDLPVASGCANYNGDDLFGADGNGIWHATFCSQDQAQIAANCINHADALADALDSVIGLVNASCEDELQDFYLARGALASYRGTK